MKIKELTDKQCKKLVYYCPGWIAYYCPEWMTRHYPHYMADNHPTCTEEDKNNKVPKNILKIIKLKVG